MATSVVNRSVTGTVVNLPLLDREPRTRKLRFFLFDLHAAVDYFEVAPSIRSIREPDHRALVVELQFHRAPSYDVAE